ncbi:MAG: hypothetical protein LAT55_03195 [Opitutales bacterium]|nr:hypothetical protein [Opitutales bacterium]
MTTFRTLLFLTGILILSSVNAKAEPGWRFLPGEDYEEPVGGLMAPMGGMGSPAPVPSGDFITDEIADLARGLRHDPLAIYNFVKNEIRHVPFYGLKKGANLCLIERSGNDFDQAALLAALLQASGLQPTYRYGTMAIPYSDSSGNDMLNWLPATSSNGVRRVLEWTGNPGFLPSSGIFNPHRVWIEVEFDGATRYLDPAYKHYEATSALTDVLSDAGYNAQDLLTAAGGASTLAGVDPKYVAEGMDLGALQTELEIITENLLNSMNLLYPNTTIEELIGGRVAVRETLTELPTAPRFPVTITESWGHGEIPETYASKIRFFIQNRMDITIPTADLQGKRLALTLTDATNFRAALWLDDVKLAEESSAPGSSTTFRVSFTHASPTFTAGNQSDNGKPYKRGASYALIYGFDDDYAHTSARAGSFTIRGFK